MQTNGFSERTRIERCRTIERLGIDDPVTCDWTALAPFFAAHPEWQSHTRATYQAHARAFFGWLIDEELRPDNPVDRLRKVTGQRRARVPVPPDGLDILLASRMHHRTRAMIVLIAVAGLRVSEVGRVRGEHFVDGNLIVAGKGNKTHVIPVHPLLESVRQTMPDKGFWFPSIRHPGEPMRGNSVSHIVSMAMRRAGIPGSGHNMRRWYGSHLIRNSNARIAQTGLRHATLQTLPLYTDVEADELRAAIEALPITTRAA